MPSPAISETLNTHANQTLDLAVALCKPGHFKLYVGDESNRTDAGFVSAEQAVASGLPFLGIVNPPWFVVDCDSPDEVEWAELRAIVDAGLGLDALEVDSGGTDRPGRHLYVCPDERTDAERLRAEADRLNAKAKARGCVRPPLDVRNTIRPPGSPHRSSGRCADPLNMSADEALDWVRAHARRHDTHNTQPRPVGPATHPSGLLNGNGEKSRSVQHLVTLLPDTVVHLLQGQPPTDPRFLTETGRPDRSRVDAAIATHCFLVGLTLQEYLAIRSVYPSAKADERSSRGATAYLVGTFEAASRKVLQSHLAVETTLNQINSTVESLDFDCKTRSTADKARLVVLAFTAKARDLDRLHFAWSRRDISSATGIRKPMVDRLLATDGPIAALGIIQHAGATQGTGHAQTYRLAAPNATVGQASPDDIDVPATHPLFHPTGLGVLGHRSLGGYSADEPRRRVDAWSLAGGAERISRTGFYKHTATLLDVELLLHDPTDDRLLVRAVDVDWDALAVELGSAAIAERAQLRTVLERRGHRTFMFARAWRAAGGRGAVPLTPTSDGRRVVDTTTGEVLALADAEARLEVLVHRPPPASAPTGETECANDAPVEITHATRRRCTPTVTVSRHSLRQRIWRTAPTPDLEKICA